MTTQKEDVKPLTPAERKDLAKASKTRWNEKTNELRTRRREMAGSILQYRYDVGLFALEIIADKATETQNRLYGTHTVEDICEAIGESSSTIHSCIKFARKISVTELEHFKKKEYPWRAVASLITVDDAKAYVDLKKRFESGQFQNTDELKSEIKSVNEGKREKDGKSTTKSGNSAAASMVKSFNTMLNQATSKVIPGLLEAIDTFVKKRDTLKESTAEAVKDGLKEARKNIRSMKTLLERAEKTIENSGV